MVAGDDDSRCPRNEPVWQFSFSALDNLSNKARRRFFPKRIPVFQHSVPALDDLIGIHFYFPLLGWHWWRRFALSWGSILFCGGVAPSRGLRCRGSPRHKPARLNWNKSHRAHDFGEAACGARRCWHAKQIEQGCAAHGLYATHSTFHLLSPRVRTTLS